MFKKDITYIDYNDVERTESFYFNLTKAEVFEWEMGTTGGMAEQIGKMISAKDTPELIALFKNLILKSYGQKSQDGKHFIKSEEIFNLFSQTEAYSQLFMLLATDAKAAVEFVNGIMPKDLVKQANEAAALPMT